LKTLPQRVIFRKTTQKLLQKFPRLATSGRHNSAMITDAENSLPKHPHTPYGMSSFYYYR